MAIAPTGAIYKSLIFDGEDSRNYGVYITGQAVFNAPEREVEMITIPARNGLFALDQGRFENIEVTYPAGIFADTDVDFAQAISDFRNFLCSRKGYCRLTDDYNPNEYRVGIYKSGLDVKPAQLKAGEFNITFDCKPQRFLTSGETAVTVASGDTITNPTLFESSPMLEVEGYGNLVVNNFPIEIQNVSIGEVELHSSYTFTNNSNYITIGVDEYNTGDPIIVDVGQIGWNLLAKTGMSFDSDPTSISDSNSAYTTTGKRAYPQTDALNINTATPVVTFTSGTNGTSTNTATVVVPVTGSLSGNLTITCSQTIRYTSSADHGTISLSKSVTISNTNMASSSYSFCTIGRVTADSSLSALGTPTYIDCDLGDAYLIRDGSYVSLNSAIDLGSYLPVLSSGTNEITYDNTITDLKVIPRWWKV